MDLIYKFLGYRIPAKGDHMQIQMTQNPSATISGQKILIQTPETTNQLNEFMDTLPNRRWAAKLNAWAVDYTPAVAWKLGNFVPHRFSLSAELQAASDAFAASLLPAQPVQPPNRRRDLWTHQQAGYAFTMQRDSVLLDMWMGTGKSAVAVNAMMNRNCKTILIICPTKVRGVWRRELQKWSPVGVSTLILDKGTVKQRAEKAEKHMRMAKANGEPCAIVINYESAWRPEFEKFAMAQQWDAVLCDESHKIKGPQSKASKFCAKLHPISKFRLCLSGTPMTHSPLDVFSQFRFLDPGIFGTSWQRFRDRYAVIGSLGADHVVGYKNLDELSAKTALLTFEAGKEVLDFLPPVEDRFIEDELDEKSQAVYDSVEQHLCGEVNGGLITASNVLVKLMRLQQITSGYCPVEELDGNGAGSGAFHLEHLGDAKIRMLEEMLEEIPADEPVVVFCKFKEDLARIQSLAEATGRVYGEISGSRADITTDGTMPPGITLMGVQIQSGGAGIDLTRACYVVYYSVGYSLGDYQQSRERCHRPGQTRATFIYHLILRGTIDEIVYKALRKREKIIDKVVDFLKAGAPHDPNALLDEVCST